MFLPSLRSLVLNIIVPPRAVVTPPGPSGPTANTFMFVWGRNAFLQGFQGSGDIVSSDNSRQIGSNNWSVLATGKHNAFSNPAMGAIRSGGSLWTWGAGTNGQRGSNNTTAVSSPVQVGADTDWSKLSIGTYTAAAVKTNGTLWMWGRGTLGQLGQNTNITRSSPVQVGTDSDWADVLVGEYHTLALKTNGTIWSWGRNSTEGALGLGDTVNRSVPVQIGTGTNWSKIGIGARSSAAITNTGQLWVWGSNSYGMLGNGNAVNVSSPVQVGSLTDWADIELGGTLSGSQHASAIKTNGTLWTWGINNNGQLGTSNTTNRSSPVQVGTDTNWSKSKVSRLSIGAVKNTGTLWFIGGRNTYGEFEGKISSTGANLSPIQVGTDTNWANVRGKIAAAYSSFGIKTTGTLWAWGNNTSGQLGLNDTTNRSLPTQVGTGSNWGAISHYYTAGTRRVLATRTNGTLWAWGTNTYGQLGLGDALVRSSPVQVGALTTWGITGGWFSASPFFSAAIKSGELWTWGRNNDGQLGLLDAVNRSSPVQVGTDTNWSQVSCGRNHSLALKTTGTLWAWGYNGFGQLGISTPVRSSSPIQIGTDTNWSFIAAGYNCSLAIKTTGTLWMWGSSSNGRIPGYSIYASPIQIGALTNWSKVYTSTELGFAIKTDGTLWGWGRNNYGSLGNGNGLTVRSPVQIGTGTGWFAATPGQSHTLATKSDGTLWAWGVHGGGRCGFAGNTDYRVLSSSPVQIGSSLNTWTDISTRSTNTFWALRT